jgi:hypothetical protein
MPVSHSRVVPGPSDKPKYILPEAHPGTSNHIHKMLSSNSNQKKERVENIIPHYAVVVKASGQRGKEQDLST